MSFLEAPPKTQSSTKCAETKTPPKEQGDTSGQFPGGDWFWVRGRGWRRRGRGRGRRRRWGPNL